MDLVDGVLDGVLDEVLDEVSWTFGVGTYNGMLNDKLASPLLSVY
jgi:hypothetical protein